MALPLIAGLALGSGGAGGALSSIGLGSVSNLLSSTLGSITNPIGTISGIGKTIGGIFGGGTDYIMADRNDVVLGNGSSALVILYNHPAKQGGRIIITEPMNVPDMFLDGQNWHDSISAIDVAKGASIVFYEHPNYGGHFDGLNGDNMRSVSNPNTNRPGTQQNVDLYNQWNFWNDRISSFKVTGQAVYGSQKITISDPPPRPQNTDVIPNTTDIQNNISSNFVPVNSATNTTNNTTTEPQKNGSMMWIVFLLLGGFLFKDKIKKML